MLHLNDEQILKGLRYSRNYNYLDKFTKRKTSSAEEGLLRVSSDGYVCWTVQI